MLASACQARHEGSYRGYADASRNVWLPAEPFADISARAQAEAGPACGRGSLKPRERSPRAFPEAMGGIPNDCCFRRP